MRLLIACALLHVTTAHGEPHDHVIVAARDPSLVAALDDALAPQRVTSVEDVPPMSIGELASASRQLVEREQAGSAIWLIADGGITTLVAYDRNADRVLVRTIPYAPPFDETQAAITAQSARAMLRALATDEVAERTPPALPTIEAAAQPAVVAPKPRLATATGLGVRFGSPGSTGIAELSLGAVWRPRDLGVSVDLALALAPDIHRSNFEGSIGDRSVGAMARWPVAVTRSSTLALGGGIALHAIRFAGKTPMRTIADWRFDPAARLGIVFSYALHDGVDVGLALSADFLLRRHRYEVEGQEILVMAPLQGSTGISLTVRVR